MKKLLTILLAVFLTTTAANAQRVTDPLDRGLVAVSTSSGVYCSWRILADEYYDVTYNLYRGSTKIADGLTTSNYTDTGGSTSSTYTVKAVIDGVEQSACTAVSVWSTKDGNSNPYLPIQVANVVDRNGTTVWANNNGTVTSTYTYTINDISLGDVDGDGKIDFIVKRKNQTDQDNLFPTDNTTAFCRIEVYASSKNYGLLWYIDCGPNTVYGSDEQWDAVAFDWDQDGRCEVLYRAYANTIIHKADGSTVTIGSSNENIRSYVSHVANMTFTNCGNEYLVYMDGKTGAPYVTMEYPLKRLESSEFSTSINWDSPNSTTVKSYLSAVNTAWGDSYGHRSSKYFMGAPYLDGRKASIYLGRGIYTRHKMIAYDVDPSTHALTQKWTWSNNTSKSDWYGNGYHNYSIADVDGDGRDEIVYGSMVIDDNGKGLSTTGLGHGDASHTGDLDPFRKGLETYACNEDEPGNNFRNAATCEIYYRHEASDDDGRAMAGNFSNDYPGGMAASSSDGVLSLTTDALITGLTNNWNGSTPNPMALNFRIYWDGDLLEETINGPGSSEGDLFVDKLGARIMTTSGTACCNGTKKNPSATGDIIGDWREELIMRSSDNTEFRVYTTTVPTSYRIPCLWFNPEYRQSMVWQTEGYNQPPHTDYFLGDLEGFTVAPPALTNTGKTELAASSTITSSYDGQDLLVVVEPSKATNYRYLITLDGSVEPKSLTVNTPVIVAGNNGSSITSTQYNCNISYTNNGTFSGSMRLIKQGEGQLTLPNKTMTYTGQTDVWNGTLYTEKGSITNSKVWLNRHTTLSTASGSFLGGVEMLYNSAFDIGTSAIVGDLTLHYGARILMNVNSSTDATQNDHLYINGTLTTETKDWQYGPTYQAPVLEISSTSALAIGKYEIGTLTTVSGSLDDIVIKGSFVDGTNQKLIIEDGVLYLKVYDQNDDYVGTVDKNTAFWGDFSNSYKIQDGYKCHFSFTNYGNSANNYYNWVLALCNGSGHSTADRTSYAEYFILRADNYGWGNYYNTPTLYCNGEAISWDTFNTDMAAGAKVEMDVAYQNSLVTVDATITATSGNIYTYSFTSKTITADYVVAFLTVDYSYLTIPEVTISPCSNIKMTYVDGSNTSTSQGEVTTAEAGYNKISGGSVAFANSGWGVNYITYMQLDLSAYKKEGVTVNSVNFGFKGSGSTDSKRTCGYGIGYNSSTWSSSMTYDTADKSITTVGSVLWSGSAASTVFTDLSWDITSVFNSDADGIITILVYETAASGGYITSPSVSVDFTRDTIDDIVVVEEEETADVELAYTAAVQGGSNNTATTVNTETHYYNGWGSSGWVAQAYIDFNVTVPTGKQISGATLTFTSYCGGNQATRDVDVYLLDKTAAAAFNPNSLSLSQASGTLISTQTDNLTESTKTITFSSDNLTALNNAITAGSTVPVVFQLGGAVAGATLYGYGSTKKPTLVVTIEDAPIPTYTITYNLNRHGTAIDPVTGATTLPTTFPTPTDTEYDFGGWYTDEALTQQANPGVALTADITLYAKWTEKIWTDDNMKDVTSLIKDPEFTGLTVSGSTFGGWSFTKNDGNGPMYPFGASLSNACEFWSEYAANLQFTLYQTISSLPAGTYLLSANAANSLNGIASNGNTGRAILYADNVDGSTNYIYNATDQPYPYTSVDVISTDADANRSTYSIYFTVDETKNVTIGFRNNGTMEARWFNCDDFTLQYCGTSSAHRDYQVKFMNDGSQYGKTYVITNGLTVSAPIDPTMDGYKFVGWSLTEDGATVTFPYTITEATTFYAVWENNLTTRLVWDFSPYTDQVVLAGGVTEEYNGLTLLGNTDESYVNDYVSASSGFRMNGASSATMRYIKYTPAVDGKLTVTYRSNNSTATDRITAIGTEVVVGADLATLLADTRVLAAGATEGATAKTIAAKLTAGTTYYIYFANGGQAITKLEYTYGRQESITANVATGRTFGSFSSIYHVDFSDASSTDAIAAYTVKYNEGTSTVRLTRHRDVLPAYNGVVLYAPTDTKSQTLATVESTTVTMADNDMVGVPVATAVESSVVKNGTTYYNYGLSADAFHPIAAGTMPAGKAYLSIMRDPSASSAKALAMSFDDDILTGIDDTQANSCIFGDGKIYNLQGIEVDKPVKGNIYIINNKKVTIQ